MGLSLEAASHSQLYYPINFRNGAAGQKQFLQALNSTINSGPRSFDLYSDQALTSLICAILGRIMDRAFDSPTRYYDPYLSIVSMCGIR